jgi:hypothetical protein
MKKDWLLLVLAVVLLTAARLWLAVQWAVNPDEALFWLCTQRMELAFFDFPWGVPWAIQCGVWLAGDSALGLRLFFPIFAGVVTLAAWVIGGRLGGTSVGWWSALLLNAAPGFQLAAVEAGAVIPALAGSLVALAVLSVWRSSVWAWMLAGIAIAFAVQFSMWPLLVAVAALAFLVPIGKQSRAEMPWLGLILFYAMIALGMLPFLIWNFLNHWPMGALSTFQTLTHMSVGATVESVNQAVRVVSGPALLGVAVGLIFWIQKWRRERKLRLLGVLALPFVGVWLFCAVTGQASVFLILMSFFLLATASCALLSGWLRVGLTLSVFVLMCVQFYIQATSRMSDLPWSAIRRSVEALVEAGEPYQSAPIFLIAQSDRLTASLNYHLDQSEIAGEAEVFLLESQNLANQFGLWPSYDDFVETELPPDELFEELRAENPYVGRSALYITREPASALPQAVTAAFESIQLATTISMGDAGTLYIYFCRNYQTLPL